MQHSTRFSKPLIKVLLVFILILGAVQTVAAQATVNQLAGLAVELWPDYDRPAMLVLLTGTLTADTTLPATLTIPIPAEAEIHAVASFNEAGALMSNVDYTIEDERMTLITPSNRFRVEYYHPYVTDGNEYTYEFNWVSDQSIDGVTVVVQQPIAATDFRLTPAAASSSAERGDNLTYHTLPSRALGAGEPLSVQIAYTADAPVLSAPSQSQLGETAATAPATSTPAPASNGFDPVWLLVGAGVLAVATGAWYLGQRQGRAARARKPQPTRPAKTKPANDKSAASPPRPAGTARFCHNCGQRAQPADTFCRNCGTQLKGN